MAVVTGCVLSDTDAVCLLWSNFKSNEKYIWWFLDRYVYDLYADYLLRKSLF